MTHFKSIVLASAVAVSGAISASDSDALPFALSGDFTFEAYNYDPVSNKSENSQAKADNFTDLADDDANTGTPGYVAKAGTNIIFDTFTYSGRLDFRQGHNGGATTTVSDWLNTATDAPSGLSGLDPTFAGRTLSAGQGTGDGSAGGSYERATLFKITASSLNIGDLGDLWNVKHDDGVTFLGFGGATVASVGPNSEKDTSLNGELTGGATDFTLYYAAANGNPSVLEVNAIPLPAAAWLLLGVSGALVAAKRRSARRAA